MVKDVLNWVYVEYNELTPIFQCVWSKYLFKMTGFHLKVHNCSVPSWGVMCVPGASDYMYSHIPSFRPTLVQSF